MSNEPAVPKPARVSTALTAPVWAAADRGVLLLQRCRSCGWWQFYPRDVCTRCWSQALEYVEASGEAQVATFTVVGRPGHPAWVPEVPYVLALVTLAEGPTMMTNIIGIDPQSVQVGMPVRLAAPPEVLTFRPR